MSKWPKGKKVMARWWGLVTERGDLIMAGPVRADIDYEREEGERVVKIEVREVE